jgi:spore coat polysaccharide biosynthesis protein SpsF
MSSYSSYPTVIVQARMGASRLPGKPLFEVLGRPLLAFLIERLKACRKIAQIAVATSVLPQDDPIAAIAGKEGAAVIRGDETDVLSRYALACKNLNASSVIRITGDCPLIDPEVVDLAADLFMGSGADYVSNTQARTYPRGLDVEVFSREVLEMMDREAKDPEEREHVTLFIHRHPDRFQMKNFTYSEDASRFRLTVDTEQDFELIRKIFEALYPSNPPFRLADMLLLLKKYPEWAKINAGVFQKIPKGSMS